MWLPWMLALWTACGFSKSIADDNALNVGFEFATSGADEKSGTIMVPVVLSRESEAQVTVDYSLLGTGNATAGEDFELASGTLVFEPGDIRKEVPVTIKEDADETEPEERFAILLMSPVGA